MLLISALILFCTFAVGESKDVNRTKRIVNGVNANFGEVSYQVSLQYDDSTHFCGGAVLNERYVITAGHCAYDKRIEEIQIVVGTTDLLEPKAIHNAIWIYVHEKFKNPGHFANDIALIKVSPVIEFDERVSPVVLPKRYLTVPEHQPALASGWGSTKGLELSLPLNLKKLEVTIVGQEYCAKLYKSIYRAIYPTQLCTHDVAARRKGVCIGDSGGPLTINNNLLIGIISWSSKDPDCASPLYPDVHTRVTEYVDWIKLHAV